MTALTDLLAQLKAADGPSREIDADLCIALQYVGTHLDGPPVNLRRAEDDDEPGWLWYEFDDEECCDSAAKLTGSIDAAVALIERVLPGWRGDLDILTPFSDDDLLGARLFAPTDDTKARMFDGEAPTPALALLIALFEALVAREKGRGNE